MANFIKNLEKKATAILNDMHYYAKGFEKEIIESVLIKRMYS